MSWVIAITAACRYWIVDLAEGIRDCVATEQDVAEAFRPLYVLRKASLGHVRVTGRRGSGNFYLHHCGGAGKSRARGR